MNDFLDYLKSVDRSAGTINGYRNDLEIFFVWNLENNKNKKFIDITKREFARFQSNALENWGWGSNRIRRVKSAISSLSNFIENILDEEPEYEDYRSIIRKIESPVNDAVREKTVLESEDIQKLLDYLVEHEEYRKAAVVALAAFSGRRKAEIPRFKVSYFEEKNVLFGSLYKTDEKVKTKGRGSKGKLLNLYVLKNQFDPYLNLWMKEREKLGFESEWLFPDMKDFNKPIGTSTMDSWKDEFSAVIGAPFYWHSLRHYFTTELAKSNIPSSVIQDIIGWTQADMVNLYVDTSADENIGKYFDENGIKQVEAGSISDL